MQKGKSGRFTRQANLYRREVWLYMFIFISIHLFYIKEKLIIIKILCVLEKCWYRGYRDIITLEQDRVTFLERLEKSKEEVQALLLNLI